MQHVRHLLLTALATAIVIMTGCAYQVQHLTPAEQTAFRSYSKVMTSPHIYTYLAKATPAERDAYLNEIGVQQRFQALEPQDRESVLAGFPRKGMSAEAMLFLWGKPYDEFGYAGHHEYWHYLGSTFELAASGNQYGHLGTIVEVFLVDGRVEWWFETTDSDIEKGGDEDQDFERERR